MWQRRVEWHLLMPIAQVFRHTHPHMAGMEQPQITEWAAVQPAARFAKPRDIRSGPRRSGLSYRGAIYGRRHHRARRARFHEAGANRDCAGTRQPRPLAGALGRAPERGGLSAGARPPAGGLRRFSCKRERRRATSNDDRDDTHTGAGNKHADRGDRLPEEGHSGSVHRARATRRDHSPGQSEYIPVLRRSAARAAWLRRRRQNSRIRTAWQTQAFSS